MSSPSRKINIHRSRSEKSMRRSTSFGRIFRRDNSSRRKCLQRQQPEGSPSSGQDMGRAASESDAAHWSDNGNKNTAAAAASGEQTNQLDDPYNAGGGCSSGGVGPSTTSGSGPSSRGGPCRAFNAANGGTMCAGQPSTPPDHVNVAPIDGSSSAQQQQQQQQQQSSSVPQPPTLPTPPATRRKTTSDISPAPASARPVRPDTMMKTASGRLAPVQIYDDAEVMAGYRSVPVIEVDRLPRGGISLETKAIGRIQFGIPPETIKDSMRLGFSVPSVYIVPVERFCREAGPALGINLAEFEFPGYFNYFVKSKQCTLIVDSPDAEANIRRVFGETLLGPAQFRRPVDPKPHEEEDFDLTFPFKARPNFANESRHFRAAEATEKYDELCIEMLLEFQHFRTASVDASQEGGVHENLGVPPVLLANCGGGGGGGISVGVGGLTMQGYGLDESKPQGNIPSTNSRPPLPLENNLVTKSEHGGAVRKKSFAGTGRELSRASTMSYPASTAQKRPSHVINADKGILKCLQEEAFEWDQIRPLRRAASDPDLAAYRQSGIISNLSQVPPDGGHSWDANDVGHDGEDSIPTSDSLLGSDEVEDEPNNSWTYSQAKWLGDVCTVYPSTATDKDRASKFTARVEVFKMAGGTEYIVHDIDENNIIVGKARFSGTVRVSDSIAVHGFNTPEGIAEDEAVGSSALPRNVPLPNFHPPSFGVTVLGNSHGFDKSGSTSGYVLWINKRGVMIDPPPYASATLEREGIRPRMIMAIIVTHIHADHDAGAFQKVMTGSRVAIITTPTIYKSFIRKYSALSGLSPALLRHSHRHRPAIVGKPLEFHGARFHFTYTLHTIPCIAFRVEFSGRSMVFTGDHLNSPPVIEKLQEEGVLTRERADDLRRLPLQDCDLLLHESGAPPIHTQLDVLLALPERVKKRMYIVHTAALPDGCELRVAPTGTAGTIRLDQDSVIDSTTDETQSADEPSHELTAQSSSRSIGSEVIPSSNLQWKVLQSSQQGSVSQAWFVLNLLSDVPFVSSLPYSHTMELLETAQVEVFDNNEVVVPVRFRSEVLCIVWEGTCVEKKIEMRSSCDEAADMAVNDATGDDTEEPAVWHPGDWTGPISLQPDLSLSGESQRSRTHDIVAASSRGVKVIMLGMKDMHSILRSGSPFYCKYLATRDTGEPIITREGLIPLDDENGISGDSSAEYGWQETIQQTAVKLGLKADSNSVISAPHHINVLKVLNENSAFHKLSALQKRHLESLAEGPTRYERGESIWWVGKYVDHAYLIVSGTAVFRLTQINRSAVMSRRGSTGSMFPSAQLDRRFRSGFSTDPRCPRDKQLRVSPNTEYARLEIWLQQRAAKIQNGSYEDRDVHDTLDSRDRFANKVLGRLYSRRAWTSGLVFSRGHFLCDTSRMVRGMLAFNEDGKIREDWDEGIHEVENEHHVHSTNLAAGPDGCTVMVFPRATWIAFLDAHPGVLLSSLGTQVIV